MEQNAAYLLRKQPSLFLFLRLVFQKRNKLLQFFLNNDSNNKVKISTKMNETFKTLKLKLNSTYPNI